MAAIWLLSAVCVFSCLCLGILWSALLTDKLWHMCWIWSDKYVINIQLTICSFKAKRGLIRTSLEKALTGYGARKLFHGRMWLGEAIDMICDTGLINAPPWRSVALASQVMLVSGGITSACLLAAGIVMFFRYMCEARRCRLTGWTLLILAPLSAVVGLLQYLALSTEMRTDSKAELGNGFLVACLLAALTLVPAVANHALEEKIALTPTEEEAEEIELQSARCYRPRQPTNVDSAAASSFSMGRVPTMDSRRHPPGASLAAGADWQQHDRHAPGAGAGGDFGPLMGASRSMRPQWPDPYAMGGGDCGPSMGPTRSMQPMQSTRAAPAMGGHQPSLSHGPYGQARSIAGHMPWRV